MRNEFTAIIHRDDEWYIAFCLEIPGANGHGNTREECLESLREGVALVQGRDLSQEEAAQVA
jgi:predicted RNase H-like HicB family nuclease